MRSTYFLCVATIKKYIHKVYIHTIFEIMCIYTDFILLNLKFKYKYIYIYIKLMKLLILNYQKEIPIPIVVKLEFENYSF